MIKVTEVILITEYKTNEQYIFLKAKDHNDQLNFMTTNWSNYLNEMNNDKYKIIKFDDPMIILSYAYFHNNALVNEIKDTAAYEFLHGITSKTEEVTKRINDAYIDIDYLKTKINLKGIQNESIAK